MVFSVVTSLLPPPRQSHFLVVGLARNASKTLANDVARTAHVLGFAARISWLVIESDSSDDTVDVLETLCSETENFRYLSLGDLRRTLPQRTARIAHCRNTALDEIAAHYGDVDYVILSDMDNLNTRLTEAGVLSCWSREDWGAVTANQSGRYHDIWALRHEDWCPNDCWRQNAFFTRHGVGYAWARLASVYLKMIRIPQDAPWIEVQSAFGGFAIYTREAITSGRYTGLYPDGSEWCEHVPFHGELRAAGHKVFINPALINTDYSSHTPWNALKRKIWVASHTVLRKLGLMKTPT